MDVMEGTGKMIGMLVGVAVGEDSTLGVAVIDSEVVAVGVGLPSNCPGSWLKVIPKPIIATTAASTVRNTLRGCSAQCLHVVGSTPGHVVEGMVGSFCEVVVG
jgi:hypothetical protein